MPRERGRPRYRSRRRGQSLIEFAVVALVTYLLLAAILTFGMLFFGAQSIQTAVDVGARELSRTPLPANETFEEVMAGSTSETEVVKTRIYDKSLLVFPVPEFDTESFPRNMNELVTTWPVINQQLYPLMILDPELQIGDRPVIRYPGTVVTTDTGLTVVIPLLSSDGTTITWVEPVEEIDTEDAFIGEAGAGDPGERPDPFMITSLQGGIVAMRINYPFQATAMTGHIRNPAGPFEPTLGTPIPATDAYVQANSPRGSLLDRTMINDQGTSDTGDDVYTGPYGGRFGLGVHGAMGQAVRPFRRVISAQAIYRREVFD